MRADRQTGKQTDRQTDRHTDTQKRWRGRSEKCYATCLQFLLFVYSLFTVVSLCTCLQHWFVNTKLLCWKKSVTAYACYRPTLLAVFLLQFLILFVFRCFTDATACGWIQIVDLLTYDPQTRFHIRPEVWGLRPALTVGLHSMSAF